MKTSTLSWTLAGLTIVCVGAAVYLTADNSNMNRHMLAITPAAILSIAQYDSDLSSKERSRLLESTWTLKKLFVAEAKRRGEYLVVHPELTDVCLAVHGVASDYRYVFHKQCPNMRP